MFLFNQNQNKLSKFDEYKLRVITDNGQILPRMSVCYMVSVFISTMARQDKTTQMYVWHKYDKWYPCGTKFLCMLLPLLAM